jgi:hypothetical protein
VQVVAHPVLQESEDLRIFLSMSELSELTEWSDRGHVGELFEQCSSMFSAFCSTVEETVDRDRSAFKITEAHIDAMYPIAAPPVDLRAVLNYLEDLEGKYAELCGHVRNRAGIFTETCGNCKTIIGAGLLLCLLLLLL